VFVPAALTAEYVMPRLADLCIAVSNTTKRRLVNLLKVPPENIDVIPNGVDCKAFDEIYVKKESARIVYVGRLEKHKRVDLLILAFNELRKSLPECELFIIGDGSQRENLVRLASTMKIEHLFFTGILSRTELVRILKSSTILVLPSVFEGHGIVLLEAMAAGTPPIAVWSTDSGVKEVVIDGFNGMLVQANVAQIRETLYKLLTDKELYDRLRENGLNFVKKYDWDNIVWMVANSYEDLITKWKS
jgi:glycosyltransferase involved in cell wall biosynthesis